MLRSVLKSVWSVFGSALRYVIRSVLGSVSVLKFGSVLKFILRFVLRFILNFIWDCVLSLRSVLNSVLRSGVSFVLRSAVLRLY